ncbi:NUDIX hydrolase [Teichococcus aestuarii]|nr:NUDIX hydrolase [Pseudoroseomonas aestuarii]
MQAGEQELSDEELRTLESLLARLSGRGASLPKPLFRFITEVSATANVDLLVRDGEGRVLLAWRDDAFGTGWHVPGSIIRHREDMAHRIEACARDEFGCAVEAAERPVALLQIFDDRGHSISLCYPAMLRGSPGKRIVEPGGTPEAGDLCWFTELPAALYPSHFVYREVLEALEHGQLGEGARLFTQRAGRRGTSQAMPEGVIRDDAPLA